MATANWNSWPGVTAGVTATLTEQLRADLVGVYLHGSAALGGWVAGSDVDMLAIVSDGAIHDWNAIGHALATRGEYVVLELSVVRKETARVPTPPWRSYYMWPRVQAMQLIASSSVTIEGEILT